jgi:hypothetical protein
MKIIGVIMVFNCGDIVLNALKSIDGLVDEIHCYDSLWIPAKTIHSSDDTKSVIEEFAKTSKSKIDYQEIESPISEGKARAKSIENIAEGDWVFVLDADEWVTRWDADVRSILEKSTENGYYFYWENKSLFTTCRFFKKTNGMSYHFCNPCINGKNINDKGYLKGIGINVCHNIKKRRCPHASGFAQRPHP